MWPFRRTRPGADPARVPDIIIAGLGVHDRAQLSVEVQRTLSQYGRAFALGVGPNVRNLLRSLKIEVTELDNRFAVGRHFADVYADVIGTVLQRAAIEKPAILLTPGNPMFMNTVARTLVMEGRRLQLNVQVLPGISLFDTLVSEIGIDAGMRGLQVFDSHWLVANQLPMSSKVPALLLNLQGFGLEDVPGAETQRSYDPLIAHLQRFYRAEHSVTLIRTGPTGGLGFERAPLGDLATKADQLPSVTCLFLDAELAEQRRD
jgi:hypothetical protein